MYRHHKNGIRLLRASDIEMRPLEYVVDGLLLQSKLNILMGKGACGKTTVAIDLAARVSNGGTFANGSPVRGGSVIIWSCEDDIDDTLAPRLYAAGANMDKVRLLDGMDEFHTKRAFDFQTDLPALTDAIEAIGDVRLIVIDTILDTVSGTGNASKAVRRDLQRLVSIAAKYSLAILGIAHVTKSFSIEDPVRGLVGSQSFATLARNVVLVVKVELPTMTQDMPTMGVVLPVKTNLKKPTGAYLYEIHADEFRSLEDRLIGTSYLEWHPEPLVAPVPAILRWAQNSSKSAPESKIEQAKDFLSRVLDQGALPSTIIEDLAEVDDIKFQTLRRAREELGARHDRRTFEGRQATWWYFPDSPDESPDLSRYCLGECNEWRRDGEHSVLPEQREQVEQIEQAEEPQEAFEVGGRSAMSEIFQSFMMGKGGFRW